MPNTTNAFWQMVWEQEACVIVALTRPSIMNIFVIQRFIINLFFS